MVAMLSLTACSQQKVKKGAGKGHFHGNGVTSRVVGGGSGKGRSGGGGGLGRGGFGSGKGSGSGSGAGRGGLSSRGTGIGSGKGGSGSGSSYYNGGKGGAGGVGGLDGKGGSGSGGLDGYGNETGDRAITEENLDNPKSLLSTRIIYFDYNKSTISPKYQAIVNAHARLLAKSPHLSVRLEGHADERGTGEYNVALSEARGKKVQWLMKGRGMKSTQADVIAYGEERPAVIGSGERSWAKNRRVEIKY